MRLAFEEEGVWKRNGGFGEWTGEERKVVETRLLPSAITVIKPEVSYICTQS